MATAGKFRMGRRPVAKRCVTLSDFCFPPMNKIDLTLTEYHAACLVTGIACVLVMVWLYAGQL